MSSPKSTDSENTETRWVLKKRAKKEVVRILDFLNGERPSAAVQFGERLSDSLDLLVRMPLMGRMARSTRMLRKGYRCFVMDRYNLYYKVTADTVEVYAIVHNSQNVESGAADPLE